MRYVTERRRVFGPTRSMSELQTGDVVRVEAILLETMRALCDEVGVHEGETLVCRSATEKLLLLEAAAGHIVALPRERARFVRVSDRPLERSA
jgi:hypothetical protein